MSDEFYTLGAWRVKEGKQSEFVEAWKELVRFGRGLLNPAGPGTLLQNVDEPQQFYSFGSWRTIDDIQQMRAHPDTREQLGRLMSLCEEGRPGTFRVVGTG